MTIDNVIALMGATAALLTAIGTLIAALKMPRKGGRGQPRIDFA